MSGNNHDFLSSDLSTFQTADEIIRSILDDTALPSEISPSGELYRAVERFHGANRQPDDISRRDLIGRWVDRSSSNYSMPSESNLDLRRSSNGSPLYNLPPSAPVLPPLRSLSFRRPSAMPAAGPPSGRHSRSRASIYSERRRSNLDGRDDTGATTDHMGSNMALDHHSQRRIAQTHEDEEAQRLIDSANSQLRMLVDLSNASTRPFSELSFPSPPLQPQEPTEDSRRVKRRKLDSDRLSNSFRGFRYGRYGQVEPGQLTMEIVSCDGGIYSDDGQSYAAENILKNDTTVYCTKGSRCNIVLRHQGATVFSLKELVIKAPRGNYTAPVQEGMVFISMTSDELLTRTAQYQIQYTPSRRRSERENQPLEPILSIRHNEDGSTMTRSQARARRLYNIGMQEVGSRHRVAQIPSEFTVTPPPFQITTECSDDEGDENPGRAHGRTPNRIGPLPFESDSSDDEDEDDDMDELALPEHRVRRQQNLSNMSVEEAAEAAQIATQEAVRAVGGELMAPHARFFIERDKSKCTIKFNPPVSGRFILLKMWSPHRDPTGNIDIQAVIAKGFAGPRYFPSVELR